jgi:hypothetical protein
MLLAACPPMARLYAAEEADRACRPRRSQATQLQQSRGNPLRQRHRTPIQLPIEPYGRAIAIPQAL